jgi:hypothetical protein
MSKKTTKNNDLNQILWSLEEFKKIPADVDFTMLVIDIKSKVIDAISKLEEIKEPSEEFTEKFEPKRAELMHKHCDKDPSTGRPLVKQVSKTKQQFSFSGDNLINFNEDLKRLEQEEDFKPLIDEQAEKNKKFDEAMQKECTIEWPDIPKSLLPKEFAPEILEPIFFMVKR